MTVGKSTSRWPSSTAGWLRRERLSDLLSEQPTSALEDPLPIRNRWRLTRVPISAGADETHRSPTDVFELHVGVGHVKHRWRPASNTNGRRFLPP
ncbi:hypothetical protein OB955_22275 [Halobacteria archaeon AArc-m2/3/4]|uniref:Uncharacterized protein n=1 Tax=Natronoglomus mannanivorans TaxID=2979990 RepID=A0ABT2QKF8_9EURY|nr:hypothetical protein [Halobacteria archaeon AArc-m2/3/4]